MSDTGRKQIRVMIVDDSALMRKLLSAALKRDPAIEVVATALDGQFALDRLARVRPDVVLMDVDMPRMDGLGALDRIVAEYGLPVVMCSSQTTAGARSTIEALARGAVDFIEKPSLSALTSGSAAEGICSKVREAMGARIKTRGAGLPESRPSETTVPPKAVSNPSTTNAILKISELARVTRPEIIAIGTSTGGPPALEQVLSALPANFPLGIVIVQHMPPGFTSQLAVHLNRQCAINVREAVSRERLEPGVALIAPGNSHLRVIREGNAYLVTVDELMPPVCGHRPSVDVLFESVASSTEGRAAAFIMTGMGSDGAEGSGKLVDAGAITVAQTPDSCICFGMPKSVIDRGHARAIIPLDTIAQAIGACAQVNQSQLFPPVEGQYDKSPGR